MLKKSFQVRYQLEQVVDAVIAALAFSAAIAARGWLSDWRPDWFPVIADTSNLAWLYLLLIPLWVFVLDFSDYYRLKSVRTSTTTFAALFKANFIGIMLAFFILYVLKIKHIPRLLIFIYGFMDLAIMWVKEVLSYRLEVIWSSRPNVLFIGHPEAFGDLIQRFRQLTQWNPNLIGIYVPPGSLEDFDAERSSQGIPIVGQGKSLVDMLHNESVDHVVLSPSTEHFKEVQRTINICETEGVETWLIADFFLTSIAKPQIDEFQELPMLIFRTTPAVSWALIIKRTMDILLSAGLIILLSPLMLAIALGVKITSPGPMLFKQLRCTLHGRQFQMFKFRTMVTDAEDTREQLESENEMDGPVFKIKDDPRITRIGRLLRRHSLDELPQLFNVLVGQMSLVGPRPPIPDEVEKYENWQRRRLSMRSGITCIWQVSGRNQVDFENWMKLDLRYIDTWSLALDCKLLLKTPFVALRGTGY